MQKYIISLILIFSMLFLSDCSGGGLSPIMFYNEDKKADARFEQVLVAIETEDKDALKSMFSKQAIDESGNFDDNMDTLFGFLKGTVESWKAADGPTVENYNYQGHKYKKFSSYYYVTTNQQKYYFQLNDWPVDTEHPDNVGLYMLLVVKAEDSEKIYDGDQKIIYDGDKKLSHAGIYLPLK